MPQFGFENKFIPPIELDIGARIEPQKKNGNYIFFYLLFRLGVRWGYVRVIAVIELTKLIFVVDVKFKHLNKPLYLNFYNFRDTNLRLEDYS